MTTPHSVPASRGAARRAHPRPPRSRLRLDTLDRVRRELVKLYPEGRDGARGAQEVSRLANVLAIVARLVEGGDLERRLADLEQEERR